MIVGLFAACLTEVGTRPEASPGCRLSRSFAVVFAPIGAAEVAVLVELMSALPSMASRASAEVSTSAGWQHDSRTR